MEGVRLPAPIRRLINPRSSGTTSAEVEVRPAIDASFYDQSTFIGRVRHFFEITDMRTLFANKAKLAECEKIVNSYREGDMSVSFAEARTAKKTLDAVLHPDTGKPILLPFRMSFQVPGNLVMFAGLMNGTSFGATIAWQIINQTFNVGVNFCNRNASSSLTNKQILSTYFAACGGSVAVALGVRQMVKNVKPAFKAVATRAVPFFGVCAAHFLNVGLMRRAEMEEGVEITDSEGTIHGKSKICGKRAILQTVASRIALAALVMTTPPLIMSGLTKAGLVPKKFRLPIDIALIGAMIWAGNPFAIGVFPQKYGIDTAKLEPEFQGLKMSDGTPITQVTYNKGL
eukprot:TRINITY_DN4783_c0_g1_i1.p1 TRINITY_DN4783_c0_g1~~TRINITY_DN4783_c0_g1_i1.p1  ORF type:complete len:343 (-),score=132.74 TRINITY_DN4783_c0_g1_i1:217-1245(-)